MITEHRTQNIKTDLTSLFCKPLKPVVVLGRAHSQMKTIRVSSPVLHVVKDHRLHSFGTVGCYPASVERSASIDDRNLVTASVSEHLYAMS